MEYFKCVGQFFTAFVGIALMLAIVGSSVLVSLGMAYLGFQVVCNLLGIS